MATFPLEGEMAAAATALQCSEMQTSSNGSEGVTVRILRPQALQTGAHHAKDDALSKCAGVAVTMPRQGRGEEAERKETQTPVYCL